MATNNGGSAGAGRDGKLRDLWQVIYDAAADDGVTLNDDTVSAIERGIQQVLAVPDPLASSSETQGENK